MDRKPNQPICVQGPNGSVRIYWYIFHKWGSYLGNLIFVGHHILFESRDAMCYEIIKVLTVRYTQVPIGFLELLLLDTLLSANIEKLIVRGSWHLSLENKFDIYLRRNPFGVPDIWIVAIYPSKASEWRDTSFYQYIKEMLLEMSLILAWRVWMSKCSDWIKGVSFSAVLISRLFEISTSN